MLFGRSLENTGVNRMTLVTVYTVAVFGGNFRAGNRK